MPVRGCDQLAMDVQVATGQRSHRNLQTRTVQINHMLTAKPRATSLLRNILAGILVPMVPNTV